MIIEYPAPSGPALIMGYDWERYGKHSDPAKNEEEQGWSWTGVNAIMAVHRKYEAPVTFFVLTKVLDVPRLRDLVFKTAQDKLVEISQHSHSHYLRSEEHTSEIQSH